MGYGGAGEVPGASGLGEERTRDPAPPPPPPPPPSVLRLRGELAVLRLHPGAASRAEAAQSPGSQKAGSGVAGHLSSSAFPEGARFRALGS